MTNHITFRRVALAAAGGLLAAVALSGAAQAITENIFRYTTPKTGHFSIDVMALAPDGNSSAASYFISWFGTVTSSGCVNAGVNLPHGATMTRLVVWYTSGAGSNPWVNLVRHTLVDGATDNIISEVISNDSGTRRQKNFPIADDPLAKVNNAQYSYGFGVCLGSSTGIHGARVTYTYNHAGD